MNDEPHLLCFSKDPVLLDIRSRVLATQYKVASLDGVEKLEKLTETEPFEALVLCHTLSEAECTSILHASRTRWPGIKAVSITKPALSRPECEMGTVVDAMQGPAALLKTIAEVLRH